MNWQKYLIAVVVAFIVFGLVYAGLGTVVFADQLAGMGQALNFNATEHWTVWVGRVLATAVFCYIYVQWRDAGGWQEGLRYGVLFALFITGLEIDVFGMSNITLNQLISIVVLHFIAYGAAGIATALIYKPAEGAAAPAEGA